MTPSIKSIEILFNKIIIHKNETLENLAFSYLKLLWSHQVVIWVSSTFCIHIVSAISRMHHVTKFTILLHFYFHSINFMTSLMAAPLTIFPVMPIQIIWNNNEGHIITNYLLASCCVIDQHVQIFKSVSRCAMLMRLHLLIDRAHAWYHLSTEHFFLRQICRSR